MIKTLFVVTVLPLYDRQGASYSRILEYSKALILDKETSIYLLSYDYPDDLRKLQSEVIPNVFICGKEIKTKNSGSFLTRAVKKKIDEKKRKYFLKNLSNFLDQFESMRSGFIYPSLMGYQLEKEVIKIFKTKSIPVFSERNELKLGIALNKAFPKNLLKKAIFSLNYPFLVWDFNRQDKLAKKYDGNIAISKTMEQYLLKMNKPVIRIPILSDIDRFQFEKQSQNDDMINIGYTGSLTYKKDGLGELIKAIALLINKYNVSNIKLNIYGSGYRDTIEKLESLINKLGLSKHVFLHGKVTSEEIPEIQVQQDILVLTRPQNLQTRFGFSTKLAEYMASGVVVLTTNVSDNLLFIKDGENGFIADTYEAEKVAEKFFDIINNKKYLDKKIIECANVTATKYFNSKRYKDKLARFLFPENNEETIV